MIELQQAGKRFRIAPGPGRTPGTIEALHGVTLAIPAGAAIGVVGPNGAGKSTLFALILGFLRPTSGQIRIRGLAPREYIRTHGASYLPDRFDLPPEWRVRDALAALSRLERLPNADDRVEAAIERLGLEAHTEKNIGALSRGLLQRVGLAQALLSERELVVLDEPTEGLDPLWRLRLRETISELRAKRRTLLIASHDLGEIERAVDEVVLLENGTIRETMAVTVPADAPRRYRIELREPANGLHELFPDHQQLDGGRAFTTLVPDARDLSARLAALLDRGAIVLSVVPLDSLEERVRASLDPR